jgi:hypothetical protein
MIGGADNASDPEEVRAWQADDVRQSLSETIDQIKNLARGAKGANDPSGGSSVSKAEEKCEAAAVATGRGRAPAASPLPTDMEKCRTRSAEAQ